MLLHRDWATPDSVSIQITLTSTNLNMNEWGFVRKIKTFEQGRIIFSYAGSTWAILHVWKRHRAAKVLLFVGLCQKKEKKSTHYASIYKSKITDSKHNTGSINKCVQAGTCQRAWVCLEERAVCGDGGGLLWRDWAKQSEQRSRGEWSWQWLRRWGFDGKVTKSSNKMRLVD